MRLVRIALPALFVAGLAVALSRTWMDASDRAARALAVEHARSEFAQRAALVRGSPDADRYRAELRALLRWWFAGQTAIDNRWPAQGDQLAPFIAAPRLPAGMAAEVAELAGGTVTALREGRLEVIHSTAADGLRIDVLRAQRRRDADDAHLQISIAVWGAPQETSAGELSEPTSIRTQVPLLFRGLSFKFFDAAGKEIASMPGEGQPRLRVDLPEGLYADAPPGLVLGRYEPYLFPKDAAEAEWSLSLQTRMPSGEERVTTATWRSAIDPRWTDTSGKVWSASDTRTVEKAANN